MPSQPIASPAIQPKKVFGGVRDDEPIDDYETATHARQRQEYMYQSPPPHPPNRAAARRMSVHAPHPSEGGHDGTTGAKNRSTTRP